MMAEVARETAGLWELAGKLGASWKAIARNLGLTEPDIENLLEDIPRDSHERCYQMLLLWQKRTHLSEREGQLRQAFEKADRLDLIKLMGARAAVWSEELNRDEFIKKLKMFVKTKMSKLPLIPWVSTGHVYVDQVFTNVVLLIEFAAAYKPIISPLKSYNAIFDSLIDEDLGLINLSPTRILLLGRTGTGKTTLLTKYAFDWCMGKQGSLLADRTVVIVLPMRKLDQYSNLGQAVLDHLLPSETRITANAIERFCEDNPDDVVILLDGYDEFKGKGLKHENCGNIVKMLRNECFTSCRVVVTSRPGRAGDFQNEYENYRHVEIIGFSSKDIDEYVYKTFRGLKKPLGDKLLLYLEENHLKTELASIPLMLTAFCQLTKWTDGKDFGELNTISKLYDRLVESVFAHYKSKSGQETLTVDNTTLDELVLELGKVALKGSLGGPEEELIFSESDFSSSKGSQIIEQGLRVGFLYRDEVSCIRPQNYQELTASLKLSSQRNISFVLKSFQEKFAGKHLAYLCDGDKSSCQLFTDYLKKVNNHQRVLDLANILVFASAASRKAAHSIMVHVMDVFQSQQGENIKQYLKGKLHFKECQKTQRLIEFCLQLNFEGGCNGAFNHIFNCLFGDNCHIRLVEISSYLAKALGYLFLHSFQKHTSDEVTGSDTSWSGKVETVLSVRSVELNFVRLESSTEFREFLNCHPGSEELISRSLFDSINSQRRNAMKPQDISQLLQSVGVERPGYFRDRPDSTYFSVLPICQEVRLRQVDAFNLGFIVPALKNCLLQELVLNGVRSEDCHWSELFRMMSEGLFREIMKLALCLNGLTSCQTASLASSLKSTPKLKYLKVSGNEVGEDFVEMLPPLADVENIILDEAEMSCDAIVKIVEKVKTYPFLSKLDLRRNKQMNDAATDSLCKLIDEKRNLTEFRVSLYDVSAASLVILKDKLALAHGLTHVYLVHSPVPDTVISCTASILSNLPNLVDLRMSGIISSASVCSSETVKHFTQELCKARRLEFLSILYVKMTSLDFISMLDACRGVKSLKVFRYSCHCLPRGEDTDRECRKAKETFLQLWM